MPETLESLRSELVRSRPKRSSQGFPPELRERVAAFAREQRPKGIATSALAKQLGISRQALQTWLGERPVPRRPKAPPPPTKTLLPVQLVPDLDPEPQPVFVLTSPRGYTVEGLGLLVLADLLERLG